MSSFAATFFLTHDMYSSSGMGPIRAYSGWLEKYRIKKAWISLFTAAIAVGLPTLPVMSLTSPRSKDRRVPSFTTCFAEQVEDCAAEQRSTYPTARGACRTRLRSTALVRLSGSAARGPS